MRISLRRLPVAVTERATLDRVAGLIKQNLYINEAVTVNGTRYLHTWDGPERSVLLAQRAPRLAAALESRGGAMFGDDPGFSYMAPRRMNARQAQRFRRDAPELARRSEQLAIPRRAPQAIVRPGQVYQALGLN